MLSVKLSPPIAGVAESEEAEGIPPPLKSANKKENTFCKCSNIYFTIEYRYLFNTFQWRSSVTKSGGAQISPQKWKAKKKKRPVGEVWGLMSIYGHTGICACYDWNVRSIAVLLVLVLNLKCVFKGGSGVLPQKILQKLVQNPAILEDFMSLWACI